MDWLVFYCLANNTGCWELLGNLTKKRLNPVHSGVLLIRWMMAKVYVPCVANRKLIPRCYKPDFSYKLCDMISSSKYLNGDFETPKSDTFFFSWASLACRSIIKVLTMVDLMSPRRQNQSGSFSFVYPSTHSSNQRPPFGPIEFSLWRSLKIDYAIDDPWPLSILISISTLQSNPSGHDLKHCNLHWLTLGWNLSLSVTARKFN